ncbi:MAG TPA: hypothetical protein VFP02_04130 [Acidimicrobiales bacterium]|nr:hypothetical protein [Acidimicrobiales bacterium]
MTSWPRPVAWRPRRAAQTMAAPVMATVWSPMPPRWKGGSSPGAVSRSAMPERAQ